MIDIYFEHNYGKLYEEIEHGESSVFKLDNEFGSIEYIFLKRKIPGDTKEEYFDIVSPYGYGGPVIVDYVPGKKRELVLEFKNKFHEFCVDNNIISEFVRFHPLVNNAKDFEDVYKVEYSRKTVGTNLKEFDDPFQSEFSKSCRKNIRKSLKEGVSYRVTEQPEDISAFKQIYYSTMDRNQAKDYYYFDDAYFEKCLNYFKKNLLLVEAIYEDKIIAMGFYFIYNKTIHIHLSGTLSEFLYLSPAYILRYAVTLWGKENEYEVIHHGGGRTSDEEDNLFKFKKQFGKNTEYLFYIGKNIINEEIYYKLCKQKEIDVNIDFFPAYRCEWKGKKLP
ncbi:GNAT family N-acetyltransferase [Gracilibacillus alcaliphilus]|uniref:GNAT family N-acetyltransferase n=1 Tax=Gracilibacillus alcaliphilus TaxID=1401441 RepID=UPI001956AB47|nr:GNAT family N-acetyltransferase [Gracilibacillus alcaliphilus]MBM7678447.1 hypothetical protein [Gracilibacillus alcaliphilus]